MFNTLALYHQQKAHAAYCQQERLSAMRQHIISQPDVVDVYVDTRRPREIIMMPIVVAKTNIPPVTRQ